VANAAKQNVDLNIMGSGMATFDAERGERRLRVTDGITANLDHQQAPPPSTDNTIIFGRPRNSGRRHGHAMGSRLSVSVMAIRFAAAAVLAVSRSSQGIQDREGARVDGA
jgi:hypothetical protein